MAPRKQVGGAVRKRKSEAYYRKKYWTTHGGSYMVSPQRGAGWSFKRFMKNITKPKTWAKAGEFAAPIAGKFFKAAL